MPRGYFGIGVYRPKASANIGTLWRSASSYGAAFLATVEARYQHQHSDTCNSPAHTPLHHYADLPDLVAHLPFSCPLIGIELAEGATLLDRFSHPLRALYLLGAEDNGLPPSILGQCHDVVQIPAPVEYSLNVSVAGSLVVYDRYIKQLVRKESVRST